MWDLFDFDRDGKTSLFEKVVGIELLESSSQDEVTTIDDSDCDEADDNEYGEDDDLDEENITLANDDFTAMAAVILEGLGGSANVKSIDNCITRLRLEINDDNKIDEAKIKSSGAAGIIRPGKGNIQVIIGPKVQFVADEMEKLCK